MTSPAKKKPPLVAVLAVLIPLLALVVGAAVSTASRDGEEASSTTLGMDGDPAARAEPEEEPAGPAGGATEGEGQAGSTSGDEPEGGSSAGSSDGESAAADDGEPSRPADAGGEGDRPTVTYPQPTVPEGGCQRAGGGTAVIVLRATPRPACLRVGADQAVTVQNRTGREISFMGDNLNEIVPAGADLPFGRAADAFPEGRSTFWVQGAPKLSGLIEVG